MIQNYAIVDAFTDTAFSGNPAGVCILPEPVPRKTMQNVAMELNLSETAFICQEGAGFRLRWFTPSAEVDLCGHATLASAHILWETGVLFNQEQALFHTKSGLINAIRDGNWIIMDFPSEPPAATDQNENIIKALGVNPVYFGKNRMDYMIELSSEQEVLDLDPDYNLLKKADIRGVIVCSKSESPDYDFVSRFFAPGVGVNEDPVTGSAHCCLAPYWQEKLGKSELNAVQLSHRRGFVRMKVGKDRIKLLGKAVTVMKGVFLNI